MEGLYLLEHIVTINAGVCTQSHSTTIFTLAGRSSTLRELKIATNAFRIDDRATVTFSMGKHFVKWITSQPVRVVELSGFSYIDNNVRNEIILALFQCATLESLCMLHMNLSSIPLNQPFPQRMRRLTLSRCDLLPNDFRSLAAGLQQSYIEELDLSENSRLDQNGLLSIFSALPNSKITRLRLIGCVQYGENISWELAGPCLLESRMKSLDLSRNNITNMDATFLAQGIRGHKTLESLDVSWNQFGYKGVLALVEAASPSLRRLCFGDHLEDFCPQDEVLNIQKMAAEKSIRIL
ncbi:hypothetical protein Ae201684P_007208 [Aphanomyces euteiches]|nr:hypothetical protein Ae201684P_007208 [Aphanomyces euteiches]